jgi:hypothetical protein
MKYLNDYNGLFDNIIYILNSIVPYGTISLYLFSMVAVGSISLVLFMSGKKIGEKIINGIVKGAGVVGAGAAVEQSIRGRRNDNARNNNGNSGNTGGNTVGNRGVNTGGKGGSGGNSGGK